MELANGDRDVARGGHRDQQMIEQEVGAGLDTAAAVGTDLNRPYGALPPVSSELDAEFWRAAADGNVAVQRCTACSAHRFPPTLSCHCCRSMESEWEVLPGTGVIETYCWIPDHARSAEQGQEIFYNVAVVSVDGVLGGPVRLVTNIVDAWRRDELHVGQRVESACVKISDQIGLPTFRKALS